MAEDSDVVVVGGGSAGCILAARLSEDPARRVTLLEAGPPDTDPWIHVPAGYARMLQRGRHDWAFRTEAEENLGGRVVNWPRGKVLGGSGSINGLVFLRGSPHDYDRWAQSGARGWSWSDVLPTFRAMESWEGEPGETRGKDGPVPVSTPRRLSEGALAFIAACRAAGFPVHRDINDGQLEGVAPIQMNVRRGRRVSTARAYLHPARGRSNLRIVTGVHVLRLLLRDGRAEGVLARHADGREERFAARAEVVLAAGAIGSPALLLRSGIGDGAALQTLGIEAALHRPEVGRNLQDHLIGRLAYRTRPAGTLNERAGTPLRQAAMALGYAFHRSGPMAVGATEATLFARLTPGAEEAEAQLQFINFSMAASGGYRLAAHPGVMINFGQCRPDSRGELVLRSADPDDKPVLRPNYLSAPRRRARHDGGGAAQPPARPHRALQRPGAGGGEPAARGRGRRGPDRARPSHRRHRVPPLRHLPHGLGRERGAGPHAAAARRRGAARRRRLGVPAGAVGEHPAGGDDARRAGGCHDPGGVGGSNRFFFEKKKQKTFARLARNAGRVRFHGSKSLFASFSSEKEDSCFLPYRANPRRPNPVPLRARGAEPWPR